MVSNFVYIKTTAGTLKLISILLVGSVFGLAVGSHFASKYTSDRESFRHLFTGNDPASLWREVFLMGAAAVCLLISVVNLAAHLISRDMYWDRRTAIYDFVYHAGASLLLFASGLLFIVSAVKIFEINCTTNNGCQHFQVKLGAGALSVTTAFLFGAISSVVLTHRKDVEREALVEDK